MKLLFDENLSPKLARLLGDIYLGSAHVEDTGLGESADVTIWDHATTYQFVIVSKDSDFHALSLLRGHPPKIIWLRTGNCAVNHVENVLSSNSPAIHTFDLDDTAGVLVLA